ncbi:MAG: hypothetical protein NTY19_44855 [Planctomycetota bacterium]|nr:hypothetical protein [Planctomycetota bacterium]
MTAVFGTDLISAYLLLMAILAMLVASLLWQQQRTGRTVAVWLAAAVLGVLLGSVGSYAGMRLSRNHLAADFAGGPAAAADSMPASPSSGGPGMGGMGSGMGGGMGGGRGGPQPKGELVSVVRKLDLLTSDIAITLSPTQAEAILKSLADLDKAEDLSDDDAKAKREEILAVLDEAQKAKIDGIGLPRQARAQSSGGPAPTPPANPFSQPTEAKALSSLSGKLTPKKDATSPAPKQ